MSQTDDRKTNAKELAEMNVLHVEEVKKLEVKSFVKDECVVLSCK